MTTRPAPRLSLGPVLFNWSPEIWRDSYFRIADEAPIDAVYLGEVVCSKREPFFESVLPDVVERLTTAGKTVILSTLALVTSPQERAKTKEAAADDTWLIEANDLSTAALLAGRPHVIGPFVNAYSEGTVDYLAAKGATRLCLPAELSGDALAILSRHRSQSAHPSLEFEVQAFGRLPLAISSRCYHARSRGLHKDGCQYVCGQDPDGMAVSTLDDQDFLAVNGTQTMSFRHQALLPELAELRRMGIDWFRLWPHQCDMVEVARIYRDVLDDRLDAQEAMARLEDLLPDAQFANGYFHGRTGHEWVGE
jgi:collagenase-like PrtC family protease